MPVPGGLASRSEHHPNSGRHKVIERSGRSASSAAAEVGVWVDVLVRRELLHVAVLAPTGQWLDEDGPEESVLDLPELADADAPSATFQRRVRTTTRSVSP